MKLKELQKKITPLPWSLKTKSDKYGNVMDESIEPDITDLVSSQSYEDVKLNAAYLAHCANQMPRLLDVVKDLLLYAEGGPHTNMADYASWAIRCRNAMILNAKQALADAEEVEGI